MPKELVEIFYLYEPATKTVFWSEEMPENMMDLEFMGSSLNPNKKMAVQAFTRESDDKFGYKISELPK